VSDVYASLSSLTGKIELEYEGELKGAEVVARELVRQAVATVFDGYAVEADPASIIGWFERGGVIDLTDTTPAAALLDIVHRIDGFERVMATFGATKRDTEPARAAVADFLLEGLCALKKISRTDEGRLFGTMPARPRPEARVIEPLTEDDDEPVGKGKKKYYN
jgi:magnesium chelatase subunit I